MKIVPQKLEGLAIIELAVFSDHRGFFMERYHEARFAEHGFKNRFVQDNHSRSTPGVLRGLHYQFDAPQGKLVGVTRGRIWDVAVDLRAKSPTFGQWHGVELNGDDGRLFWIPAGFAHGFCVLGNEPADVLYKVDALYNGPGEAGILWDDPALAIRWPIEKPIVSARDEKLASFADYRANPKF